MKKLTLIFTLLFSTVMFSSPSYAEWTKVSRGVDGTTYYVEFDTMRKVNGYIYFWKLHNYIKPSPGRNFLSDRTYAQADCQSFKTKDLSVLWHIEPMGEGSGESLGPVPKKYGSWVYPASGSTLKSILNAVCNW